jgi:hypothetical protein
MSANNSKKKVIISLYESGKTLDKIDEKTCNDK